MSEDYITEAEALEDESDGGAERDCIEDEVSASQKQYAKNKLACVGAKIVCPTCGRIFHKESYQQAFCKSRIRNKQSQCKVEYHNRLQFWRNRI